jgi:hypothetical protein
MTITDNGRRSPEQLVAQARELVEDGRLPSKTNLQKTLGVAWKTAVEIHSSVSRELAEATEERRRSARAAMRRLPSRKRSRRPAVVVRDHFSTPSQTIAQTVPAVVAEPVATPVPEVVVQVLAEPVITPSPASKKRPATWPIVGLALPAFVAVWSGWVGLGGLTGFGVIQPFPGIPGLDAARLNTAITLPIGVETYAAYALYVWLSGLASGRAKKFAMWSAIGSLIFGAAGQVAFHQMSAAGMSRAPWQITTVVACLPVAVLGMGAALRHLVHAEEQ